MKITKTQLKQIIKEELSSVLGEEDSNPQALYDQMLSLERKYYHHFSEFDKLGADKYNDLISLRNKMHEEDRSYDNYGKFQQIGKIRLVFSRKALTKYGTMYHQVLMLSINTRD